MRSRRKNLIYRIIIIVFSICFLYNGKATVFSQNTQEEQPRKVKVGFFAFDGYHNMDENGNKSGYGYEVLQLMKRYENWQYEYVGYDKDWADMLSMLENGEIDMLTSAGKTAERLERFDYSDVNIGTNSVILTVRKDETRFITGHYKDYNGMKVGLLRENEKNEFFEENALQKGFTYQPIYYDNTDELKEALQTTKEIDAIATSSIRKLYHEKILEDFNPSEFFVIVKKGNKELLSEINNALLHINADDPGWRNRLEEEYYNLDSSRNFSFTEEDKYLLEKIKKDKKVVKVLVNPDNAPYSYLKNGEIAGVLPDLFAKMIKIVKIPYEYLPVTTVEEYRKELQKQRADIILDSTMSLQEIENMDMSAVGTRLSTSLTILYKRNSNKFFKEIAVTKEFMKNAKDYFGARAKLIECQSIEDCIRMVQEKNDCNATLLPSKRAELVRMSDYKNEYALALLADQTISYSLVVKQFPYNKLSALLANTVNMSTSDEINLLTLAHMDSASGKISLIEIFYERPLLFIGIIAIVVVELFVILLYTLKGKREIAQKNENLQKDNIFLKKRDSLTGGYNRNGFLSEIERLYMQNVDLTEYDILYINIKRFKVVNHMIGSENGDEIIKHLYCTVRDSLLQPELCARIEADHFAFLVRKDRLDVYLLENILHLQKEVGGKVLKPRCLCGIYQIEDMETEGSRMLNDASIALHYITDDSAVLYKFYDQNMREDYVDQAEILATYKSAIKKKEFKIHYQPIIEASTGKVASAEALVRWQKEDGRLIRPDLFIPILEKNGHISKLDSFVESSVYNFLLERQQADKVRVPVSVNLSWMDFHDKAFIEKMQERGSGITLEENTLRYEITETAYAALEGNKRALLQQLNKNGIEIVLDDFGSGYSSFGMIKDYEFGILKIDMSFIRQIVENEKVRIIVNYIIAMCHHLKIRVVAEGVETEREVELLREMKCDYLQGYYFSKPLSEEDFVKYIEGNMH